MTKRAESGPAAVFLFDREGLLRSQESWTRDAWGRNAGPHQKACTWVLVRDRDTGFVTVMMVSSPTLLLEHPRADVRAFDSLSDARAARAAFETLVVSAETWA